MSNRGRKHLIVVAGWQAVNVGDLAHIPSMLALLERELPEVEVTVWPFKALPEEVLGLIRKRFPRARLLAPSADLESPVTPEALSAMDAADFLLHGSGPATLGWRHCEAFAARTGRPFGIYGVTYGLYGIPERATLDRARFVFFRDSRSLAAARAAGVNTEHSGLALDSAFANDLREDDLADSYLREVGLENEPFVCAIARLRHTPFWEMPQHSGSPDPVRVADNAATAATLTGPVLEAVVRVVRETGRKVLLCPEDHHHIRVEREWIFDRLPEDVKPHVIPRAHFWTPGEAASIYARSSGLFGTDMHSPIMCIGMGIPALVGRWREQSTKGYMWEDIELGDWLFDFDIAQERATFVEAAVKMTADPIGAKARAVAARDRVVASQKRTMASVRDAVFSA